MDIIIPYASEEELVILWNNISTEMDHLKSSKKNEGFFKNKWTIFLFDLYKKYKDRKDPAKKTTDREKFWRNLFLNGMEINKKKNKKLR